AISPAATLIFAGPVPEVAWGKRRPRAARSGRAGPFGGGGEDPAERLDLGPQPGGGQRVPLQPAETVLDQLQLGGPEPGERAARLPRGHLPLLLLAPLPGCQDVPLSRDQNAPNGLRVRPAPETRQVSPPGQPVRDDRGEQDRGALHR